MVGNTTACNLKRAFPISGGAMGLFIHTMIPCFLSLSTLFLSMDQIRWLSHNYQFLSFWTGPLFWRKYAIFMLSACPPNSLCPYLFCSKITSHLLVFQEDQSSPIPSYLDAASAAQTQNTQRTWSIWELFCETLNLHSWLHQVKDPSGNSSVIP